MSTNDPQEARRLATLAAERGGRRARGTGHRWGAPGCDGRDHRARRRRRRGVPDLAAGAPGDGRRGAPSRAGRERLDDEGDHEPARVRPRRGRRGGDDARPAGRTRPARAFEAIRASSGNSFVHETESPLILDGTYDIGFTMDLALKDLAFARELGEELGVPLAARGRSSRRPSRAARERYGGGAWSTMVVKLLEDEVGTGHPRRRGSRRALAPRRSSRRREPAAWRAPRRRELVAPRAVVHEHDLVAVRRYSATCSAACCSHSPCRRRRDRGEGAA